MASTPPPPPPPPAPPHPPPPHQPPTAKRSSRLTSWLFEHQNTAHTRPDFRGNSAKKAPSSPHIPYQKPFTKPHSPTLEKKKGFHFLAVTTRSRSTRSSNCPKSGFQGIRSQPIEKTARASPWWGGTPAGASR